jgi:AraC-like DNA-binding protein
MDKRFKDYKVSKVISIETVHTAFSAHYDDDFKFLGERHDFWELVFVIDGNIAVSADASFFELSSSDIIFHKPMELHTLTVPKGKKAHVLVISFDCNSRALSFFESGVFHLDRGSREELLKLNEYMESYLENPYFDKPSGAFLAHWQSSELYSQIFTCRLELLLLSIMDYSQRIRPKSNRETVQFEQAAKLISERLYASPTSYEIANEMNISRSALDKLFAKYAGIGVHKYLVLMKIREAARMIDEGMSLSAVSEALNFGNRNYFSAVFKREYGVSPSEYRKRQ